MTLNKIDIIKSLWKELPNNGAKTEFMEKCGEVFDRSPKAIRQNWFSKFWNVPVVFQDQIIKMLREEIKENEKNLCA